MFLPKINKLFYKKNYSKKMPNIKYSYIFDEELDRVYDCLTNAQLNLGIAYNNLVTKLHFVKGDRFDEENAEFSFAAFAFFAAKKPASIFAAT